MNTPLENVQHGMKRAKSIAVIDDERMTKACKTLQVNSSLKNKPGTAQVGAISKAQKDSKTKTTFSTNGDNKSSQKAKN